MSNAAEEAEAEIERLRGERDVLARWVAEATQVLSTLVDEDSEDAGDSVRMLRDRGDKLVLAVRLRLTLD